METDTSTDAYDCSCGNGWVAYVGILPGDAGGVRGIFYLINYCGLSVHEKNLVLYLLLRFRDVRKSKDVQIS